tara:strand:+ start:15959 stop:16099 length:141 start_codon:yes stop_codon:yes gene_type:complete
MNKFSTTLKGVYDKNSGTLTIPIDLPKNTTYFFTDDKTKEVITYYN